MFDSAISYLKKHLDFSLQLSTNKTISLVILYMLAINNTSFWQGFFQSIEISGIHNLALLSATVAFIFSFLFVLIIPFSHRKSIKPVLAFLLILSSVIAYYMDFMGTIFDKDMIQNIVRTDVNESTELLDMQLFFYVFIYGVIPTLVLTKIQLKQQNFKTEVKSRFYLLIALIIFSTINIYYSYKELSFFFRENRTISFMINPLFPIISAYKFTAKALHTPPPYKPVFSDAKITNETLNNQKNVFILIIGETARAQNFQLNAYTRETNPYLLKQNIVNFSNVSACGTATAISVPCMLSWLDHDNFDNALSENSDNLLDALKKAGADVLWLDNNSGCQRTCDNISYEFLGHSDSKKYCSDDRCFDEILLENFDDIIHNSAENLVIVLHQQGSHGPAYYRRYPKEFAKFLPECRTSTVQNCTTEEVINAYDNTILYTDYFINSVIEKLKKYPDDINTAMLYVSDHGESLGEEGVYLHGLPYFMAPQEQTQIPMILWMSDTFKANKNINQDCLEKLSNDKLSHDNLIHSVLGVMNVSTHAYLKAKDIFSTCRDLSLTNKAVKKDILKNR